MIFEGDAWYTTPYNDKDMDNVRTIAFIKHQAYKQKVKDAIDEMPSNMVLQGSSVKEWLRRELGL